MHIFKISSIHSYCEKYAEAREQLLCWAKDVKEASWRTPAEIKKHDATVSIVGESRVVFNIKGNKFRLIADINYEKGWIFVIRFLPHNEYDKVNVATISAEF